MIPLQQEDLERAVAALPKKLAEALKKNTGGRARAYVAGGFIRAIIARESLSDVDVFVRSKAEAEALADDMDWHEGNPFVTDFATTVFLGSTPVQIIHRWTFPSAEDVVNGFDFTVAQAVLWWDADNGWSGRCSELFYPDLAARRLRYVSPGGRDGIETGGTLLRLMKYTARGYSASPETVATIAADAALSAPDTIPEGAEDVPSPWDWSREATAEAIRTNLRGVDPQVRPSWW